MSKREPSTRSVRTIGPPPTYYSAGALPEVEEDFDHRSPHVQLPSTGTTASTTPTGSDGAASEIRPYDPPYAAASSNGQRRLPTDDSITENLLRLQRAHSEARAGGGGGSSLAPTAIETETVSHFSAGGGGGYAPSITASSLNTPSSGPNDLVGFSRSGERNITNYINIVRRATPHNRIFSLFYPNPKIIDTFYVDPHLRIPGGVLTAVQASVRAPPQSSGLSAAAAIAATRRQDQHRRNKPTKNMLLDLQDGKMDVVLHLIADCDPSSSSSRRLRSVNSLQSELGGNHGGVGARKSSVPRTVLTANLSTTRPKTFKAYPMYLRIYAPQPRPPFFLQATCTGQTGLSRSPLTLFIPRSFHGPITLKIQVGNIDHHLWLSPSVDRVARMMSEDDQSRGYFIGALPDTIDEEESGDEGNGPSAALSAKEEEEWQGDKADIQIGNGKLRILFEDEELEGPAKTLSNGWIWPEKWG